MLLTILCGLFAIALVFFVVGLITFTLIKAQARLEEMEEAQRRRNR